MISTFQRFANTALIFGLPIAVALIPVASGARTVTYSAALAAPAASPKLISSERVWSCAGLQCLAGGPSDSAAKHVCSRLAGEVGALKAFRAGDRVFDAAEVAACNERAGVAVPVNAAN